MSRLRSTFFAITLFDGKWNNLQKVFLHFVIIAKILHVLTIATPQISNLCANHHSGWYFIYYSN